MRENPFSKYAKFSEKLKASILENLSQLEWAEIYDDMANKIEIKTECDQIM